LSEHPRKAKTRTGRLCIGLVSLLALSGLYGGAYWLVLDEASFGFSVRTIEGSFYFPRYCVGEKTARRKIVHQFFRPAHWVDRRLRPEVWGLAAQIELERKQQKLPENIQGWMNEL
jgi:hypothetical protein